MGYPSKIWTPHHIYQRLGKTAEERSAVYREMFVGHIEPEMLNQIRQASNQGTALGNERFKSEVEMLSNRRVVPLKRGPKKKHEIND